MLIVLDRAAGGVAATRVEESGTVISSEQVPDLAAFVAAEESARPRWVWSDTSTWYPQLLDARLRVDRCFDLRLCHAILRGSALTADSAIALSEPGSWDAAPGIPSKEADDALFSFEQPTDDNPDPVAELLVQLAAVRASPGPARIGMLLAAESAGCADRRGDALRRAAVARWPPR